MPSPDSTNGPGSISVLNMSSGNPLWTSNSHIPNIPTSTPKERPPGSESVGTTSGTDPQSSEAIFKVFGKLKPFPKGVKLTKQQLKLYKVINPAIIINLEDVEQDLNKNVDVVGKRFTFYESFGADVSQEKMFERVGKQLVINLFAGKNSTVMTYGSSSSGKSYTLEGSLSNPGLIPRTLDFIFTQEKPLSTPNYKPRDDNTLEVLNPERNKEEIEFRKRITSSLRGEDVNVFTKALRMIQEGVVFPEGVRLGPLHEIWLSFLEIRDEKYYDLLSSDYQSNHVPLEAGVNPEGQIYVQGLSHLHVGSVTDARDVLTIGRKNLKEFNLMSNGKISKSHCIFSITLLKYEEIDRPEKVQMSRFSFCDLAAHQESDLDMSLLALLKSLKSNLDTHPHPRPRPTEYFCSSKLTNLFKPEITGTSPLSLITHVDPNPGVYKDTHEALHFTAISSEILTKIRNPRIPQVTTTFGKLLVEGFEDFSDFDDLTSREATNLAFSLEHAMSGYLALDLKASIDIKRVIIEKHSEMLEKVAGCCERQKNLLKSLQGSPEDLEVHQESLRQMERVLENLQEEKAAAEAEAAEAQEELDEIMLDLPENYRFNIRGKDPMLRELELEMEIRDQVERSEVLIERLNEARDEVNGLQEDFEGDRVGELERKYLTAKLEREMDLMLEKHKKRGFDDLMKRIEMLREREIQRVYEDECRRLSEDSMEIEGSGEVPGDVDDVPGDVDGVIDDKDEETAFIDSGSLPGEQNSILRAPEELENKNDPDAEDLDDRKELEELHIPMEIDDSEEDESELSAGNDQEFIDSSPEILSDPQMGVLTPQKEKSETPDPVPEVIPTIEIISANISPAEDVLPPQRAITPRPGVLYNVSSILEDWKSAGSPSDSEDEKLRITKTSNSHNSSVTGSSADLQPPVLEPNVLLESLEKMNSGLDDLEKALENKEKIDSAFQSDSNDADPPKLEIMEMESSPGGVEVLQVPEDITRTPVRRGRPRKSTGSAKSSRRKGKKRTGTFQTPGTGVSPGDEVLQESEDIIRTPKKRRGRSRKSSCSSAKLLKPNDKKTPKTGDSPGDEVLQDSEDIIKTPVKRGRSKESSCSSSKSSKSNGKKTPRTLVSPGVPGSSGTSSPLRRSGRKKSTPRRFVCPLTSTRSKQIPLRERFFEILCDECRIMILEGDRYHCAVCSDGNYDLCEECYKKNGHEHDVKLMGVDMESQ